MSQQFAENSADTPDAQVLDTQSEFQTLHEIVQAASKNLENIAWDYLVGGSETETTLKRNRLALDSLALRPRVLSDVSAIDMSGSFFGKKTTMPVHICPVGSLGSFRQDGPAEAARAAAAFGIPIFVSSSIRDTMEQVATAASDLKVFQLYTRGDHAWIDDYVIRAKELGYQQLCVTVDSAKGSRRERDITKRYVKPWHKQRPKNNLNAQSTWDDVARLKETHKMPIILKGIATVEDAELACQAGIDVVYVSNHGGRALDQGAGTTELLPEIVQTVAGRAKVFVDGGYSRGTDVVKGLALGADSVGIGRLYVYGLAAAGSAGVTRVLQILQNEIDIAMALLGVSSIQDLKPSCLRAAPPVVPPHVHSAFPLLSLNRG